MTADLTDMPLPAFGIMGSRLMRRSALLAIRESIPATGPVVARWFPSTMRAWGKSRRGIGPDILDPERLVIELCLQLDTPRAVVAPLPVVVGHVDHLDVPAACRRVDEALVAKIDANVGKGPAQRVEKH